MINSLQGRHTWYGWYCERHNTFLIVQKLSILWDTSRNAALRAAFSASSCGKLFWKKKLTYL